MKPLTACRGTDLNWSVCSVAKCRWENPSKNLFMAASNSKGRRTVQLRKHLDDNTQRTGRTIHPNACFISRLSIFPRHAALSVPLLVLLGNSGGLSRTHCTSIIVVQVQLNSRWHLFEIRGSFHCQNCKIFLLRRPVVKYTRFCQKGTTKKIQIKSIIGRISLILVSLESSIRGLSTWHICHLGNPIVS